MTYDPLILALLCAVGFLAGGINTVAGGGSNLTLPVLMMLGLPAEIANGTNRVGVTLQCVVALRGFDRHKSLDRPALLPILIPNVLGGILGSLGAALLPGLYLKPLLLGTIIAMSALILIRPNTIAPPPGTVALSPKENRGAWLALFGAGIYGGFVQAGVGFILLAALAGGLRYDLLRPGIHPGGLADFHCLWPGVVDSGPDSGCRHHGGCPSCGGYRRESAPDLPEMVPVRHDPGGMRRRTALLILTD